MNNIDLLVDWISEARITTIFTGAGMSTESGLPDFRSQNGLWKDKDPLSLASTDAINKNFKEFIGFYRERILQLNEYKANIGHAILAEWQTKGIINTIITQNVDGFHQQAGAKDVIELHGTLTKMRCLGCRKNYSSKDVLIDQETCASCDGKLRPCVVLFGEQLPKMALDRAFLEAMRSDLFIVLGSSLEVSPANMLPLHAKESGAKFCIINRDETRMDKEADLIIRGNIGEVLTNLNSQLKKTTP
ncbi:SIR2 family NAD-dependent protein deacylase [Desulfuribacillus alkaliarsenatis]|uniref:protein acetyllysine N-acetyltransferase n=1 Tax=Desulfuribacillus alkaliarsenatis TaxID=766136 RepID=A0A1E5G028_9FIRM|nr:NAD-dependent deacylase [Desulfuribacillus alkaliarsenatis]OEF96187.1 NAD-dependent protein deacylase [Desulfuribacillus alkaliarsenatis]